MNIYEERAEKYFTEGYNCAQSVFASFYDKVDMTEKQALRYSSGFGGGMGRLREVCGAVSGMVMVLSILYGYDEAKDDAKKKELYERVQYVAGLFKEEFGTVVCRELLGLSEGENSSANPTKRTESFYHQRPCLAFVKRAAGILSDYLEKEGF